MFLKFFIIIVLEIKLKFVAKSKKCLNKTHKTYSIIIILKGDIISSRSADFSIAALG